MLTISSNTGIIGLIAQEHKIHMLIRNAPNRSIKLSVEYKIEAIVNYKQRLI
jgi:hypothetical protein